VTAPKPTRPAGKKPAARTDAKPAERVVAENRKARHDYEILDTLECGIALVGSEVKSLRVGRMSLDEA
jgi:SsrA-binding protein